jgi:hypothetical protein
MTGSSRSNRVDSKLKTKVTPTVKYLLAKYERNELAGNKEVA